MPHALWTGAISFGLVNIPVALHPAEDRKAFKFSLLDKRDLAPVGYKRYSKTTGREVAWADIVKGYEYRKDRYVVLSDEDFRQANVKATQTIDILAFVGAGEIPLEYFDTPYWLAPGKRGAKVYALLRETLKSTRRIAVAQVVIRTVPHLAAIVAGERGLMLDTLRYPDELRDPKGIDLPAAGMRAAGVTAKEVALAKRLIDDMTEAWKPADYTNSYHDDLMARIRQKVRQGKTKEITPADAHGEATPRSAQIIDLAALLRESLAKAGSAPGKTSARRRAAATAPKPAAKRAPQRKRA